MYCQSPNQMITINATLVNLYHVCKRECWLHANGITMEQTSDIVYEGKLISETSYPDRAQKYTELDLGIAKIDFYNAKNKVVHEVKKSNKMEQAHEWQVKYYIYLLEQAGIKGATGVLEYPKLRMKKEVTLSPDDAEYLQMLLKEIEALILSDHCPPLEKKSICRACSYHDFCWSGETE